MDNELLEKLLKEHNRLIIPGFGAFLRKEGQISAPIVFSPFLKKDDGLLTQILKSEYGVDNFDAETMTSEWVTYVKESLASKGKYQIHGTGLLVMDANGSIAMVSEPSPIPQKPIPSYESHQGQPTIVAPSAQELTPPSIPAEPVTPPATFSQPVASPQPIITPSTPRVQPIMATPPQPVMTPSTPRAQPIATPPQPAFQQPIGTVPPQPLPRPVMSTITPRPIAVPPRPMSPNPNPLKPTNEQPWERRTPSPVNTAHPTGAPQRQTAPPRPDGQPRPLGASQRSANAGQPKRRRPAPQSEQKQKVETLLIVAIVAAIIIVGLIIYGLATVNPTTEFYQPPM